ncbi:putative tellurium resistance protein [Gordonia araii NBRC 100433]|uniref:Putative tellurium resistance protein n=1 Tax=Gordonia araii NBRC 100433 TaxID=1073574 RepID=G7GYJ0_9ACTN|nr:TerD family protein [Gordonia araii]NNG97475.1 TerD family protein [Gordonia araii NBRC 100433]GAB08665.1 putative tellurium resistance protein [Gordonia araii NBRC 100433]
MAARTGLQRVSIGVGWDITPSVANLDLDLAAFALPSTGVVRSDKDFVFFNNLSACDGAIKLTSDAAVFRGWREEMTVDTGALPPDIERVRIAVSSYGGEGPFRQFPAGFVELWDSGAGQLARCDLGIFAEERALVYADLRRDRDRWVIDARGEPHDDLASVARSMGVKV